MTEKLCNKCRQKFPATSDYFYRKSAAKDGLQGACKSCVEKSKREYDKTEQGRAVVKRYMKAYRATEKSQQYHIQYRVRYAATERGRVSAAKRQKKYYRTKIGHLRCISRSMIQRCYKPDNHNYKYYGGRGIEICFESCDDFIDYVVNEMKVDPRGLTIDRIDNWGNYERGNIRFVTQAENNKNRRCSI